ncbi:MAG: hypothetical protein IPG74_15495 [Flavobacteriales bacterium]|nr:hypothetical protein [Flavobacteriales bacterium]
MASTSARAWWLGRRSTGETPEGSGLKGDKLVGKYYVEFDKAYKREVEAFITSGKTKEEAEKEAPSCSKPKPCC